MIVVEIHQQEEENGRRENDSTRYPTLWTGADKKESEVTLPGLCAPKNRASLILLLSRFVTQ
ncbi:MAG: hypothetical protein NTV54_14190 [Ignavibacteriales bacterium]|nr:hypothetical protein [Ignavibacteriales bacterium]